MKWRPFHIGIVLIGILFIGMMAFVTGVAYSRPSGATGLDPATIQHTRYLAEHRTSS